MRESWSADITDISKFKKSLKTVLFERALPAAKLFYCFVVTVVLFLLYCFYVLLYDPIWQVTYRSCEVVYQ